MFCGIKKLSSQLQQQDLIKKINLDIPAEHTITRTKPPVAAFLMV